MPVEEISARSIGALGGYRDRLAGAGVELLAIAELIAKPGADVQAELRIDGKVATVEQGVHVRCQQQTVVQPVPSPKYSQASLAVIAAKSL